MSAAVILSLVWSTRLACWPFEVEGQGGPAVPQAVEPPGSPTAAPLAGSASPALPPSLPPSLPLFHQARYDIRYGILGSVGSLSFTVRGVAAGADGAPVVKVEGGGSGAVLGMGGISRKIEAEFDPVALQSRRWSILRLRDGQPEEQGIRDTAARPAAGQLVLERTNPARGPGRQTMVLNLPSATITSDPLGVLWRLRTAPPAAGSTEVLQLVDGLSLWRVQVTTAKGREILPEGNRTAIRLEGRVTPIFHDGNPDPRRPSRDFTLWLSDSADHLPLRLEVPVGMGDVVMTLADAHSLPAAAAAVPAAAPPRQLTGPVPGARNL